MQTDTVAQQMILRVQLPEEITAWLEEFAQWWQQQDKTEWMAHISTITGFIIILRTTAYLPMTLGGELIPTQYEERFCTLSAKHFWEVQPEKPLVMRQAPFADGTPALPADRAHRLLIMDANDDQIMDEAHRTPRLDVIAVRKRLLAILGLVE